MHRQRVHGVIANPGYEPRAIMIHAFIPFTKDMEGIGTVPGPVQ
jgi:acyl-CoA dehydrogenase